MTLPLGGFRPRATLVFVCLAWLLLVAVATGAAQITTGTIAGRVADAQGLALPGATVTITSPAQGTRLASVTTDAEGLYVVPSLPAGVYVVEAVMPGFQSALADRRAGQRRRSRHRRSRAGDRPVRDG